MYGPKIFGHAILALICSINFISGYNTNSSFLSLKLYPGIIIGGDPLHIELVTNSSSTQISDIYVITLHSSKLNEWPKQVPIIYNSSRSRQVPGNYIFSAYIQTVRSQNSSALDSSYLNVNPGDVIIANFFDLVTSIVRVAEEVKIVAQQIVLIGQNLFLSIIDPFISGSAMMVNFINASVSVVCMPSSIGSGTGAPNQGIEVILLQETSPDSKNFTGSIATFDRFGLNGSSLLSGDGKVGLQAQTNVLVGNACPGDTVLITYKDSTVKIQPEYAPKLVISPLLVTASQLTMVQIVVIQRNLPSLLNLSVLVASTRSDEPEEIIQLYSSNPRNGTYTGSIWLGNSSAFPNQGDNFIRIFPGDNVEFTYGSDFDGLLLTGLVRVSTTGGLRLSPDLDHAPLNSNVATILTGQSVSIVLVDQTFESTVAVNVSSPLLPAPLALTLRLNEGSGAAIPVFTGNFRPPDPAMSAPMTVTYTDLMSDLGLPTVVSGVVKLAVDGILSCSSNLDALTFADNSTLFITVVDADLDQNTLIPDSTFDSYRSFSFTQTTGVVTAAGPNDTQVIQLVETGASTGVFTGTLNTTTDPNNRNGSLYAAVPGTLITISYFDQVPESITQATLRFRSVGTVYVSPFNALAGQPMQVVVVDPDLNTNAYAIDSASVTITDGANRSSPLLLYEQGRDSGNFTGTIFFTASLTSADPGAVYDTAGKPVTVVYGDQSPRSDRTPSQSPRLGTIGALTASPPIISAQSIVAVTVSDADLNMDPAKAEQYSQLVRIQLPSTEFSFIGLVEAGASSGLFTGVFNAGNGIGASAAQIPLLQGSQSLPVTIAYLEQTYGTAQPTVVARPNSVGIVSISQYASNPGHFNIGESLSITVKDSDAGANMSAVDTVSVLVQSSGFSQTVALLETGPVTGEFTGVFKTAKVSDGTSLAPIQPLNLVSTIYTDLNPSGIITAVSTAHLYAKISTQPQYLLSTTATLTVTVQDNEPDASSPQGLTYKFGANAISLPIMQNAPGSSIFTGILTLPQPLPTCSNRFCSLAFSFSKGINSEARSAQLTLLVGTDGGDGFGNGPILSTVALPYRQVTCPASLNFGGSCGPSYSCEDVSICGSTAGVLLSNAASNALVAPAATAVTITVIDLDQDLDPYNINSVSVTVQNMKNINALDTVILTENALQSGIFTALWLIDADMNSSNVSSVAGDVIQVIYSDQPTSNSTNPALRRRQINVISAGDVGFTYFKSSLKSNGMNTSVMFAGDRLQLYLQDNDLNVNPNLAETISVSLRLIGSDGSLKPPSALSVNLVETNISSGTFSGILQTVLERFTCDPLLFTSADVQLCSQTDAGMGSMGLSVSAGDEITLIYNDMSPAQLVSSKIRVTGSMTGILSVNPNFAVLGQSITISISDLDANLDILSIDSVSVQMISCNRTLNVSLLESGQNTGQFTGSVETALLGATNFSFSSNTVYCTFGGSIITVYTDQLPESRNITAITSFALPSQLSVSDIKENGRLLITVTDLDSISLSYVVVAVDVTSVVNKTSVNISLFKQSNNMPIFTGSVSTSAQYPPKNGSLFSPAGSIVTVQYRNQMSPQLAINRSVPVLPSFSATLELSPSPIQVGAVLTIQLEDQDMNTNLTVQEVFVLLSSNLSRSLGAIRLTESDVNSGVFTAQIQTLDGHSFGTGGTRSIYVSQGDVLTVSYKESAPEKLVEIYDQVIASYVGILDFSPSLLLVGGRLDITVTDTDLNQFDNKTEICQISTFVNGLGNGTLILQENNVNTGIFTGSIETTSDVKWQGINTSDLLPLDLIESYQPTVKLSLLAGDVLYLTYADQAPAQNYRINVPVSDSQVGVADVGLSSWQLQYSKGILLRTARLGDSIPVTVIDSDLNQDVTAVEEATAYAVSSFGDSISLSITEMGTNSSVFTGIFVTSDKLQSGPHEILSAIEGSTIRCIYNDQAPRLRIRSESVVRLQMLPKLISPLSDIRAGQSITMTLTDSDLDVSDSMQSCQVSVNSLSDAEVVQMSETSGISGTFTGVLPTTLSYSEAMPNSGLLDVIPNSIITASYFDANSSTTTSIVMNVLHSNVGTLSVAPSHLTLNASSQYGSISITVSDLDWDLGTFDPDECGVWFVASNSTKRIDELFQTAVFGVTLTETSIQSGIFTANAVVTSDASLNAAQIKQLYCLAGPFDWGPCKVDTDCGGSGYCRRKLFASLSNIPLAAGLSYFVLYKDFRPTGTVILNSVVTVHPQGTIEAHPRPLVAGESLQITVTDLGNSGLDGMFTVMAFCSSLPDQYVAVSVAETGYFTGIFTGILQTVAGQGPNMTSLGVKEGDAITVVSQKSKSDQSNLSVTVLVATTAKIVVTPSTIRANGLWSITVIDLDQNVNSTCVVFLTMFDEMTSTLSSETVLVLKETSPASGVFTAVLLNSDAGTFGLGSGSSSNQWILQGVKTLSIVNITIRDAFPRTNIWRSFKILNSALGVIAVDALSLDGQVLKFTITDRDQDYNYTEIDHISATFRSNKTGDKETVVLVESSFHSGSFTGEILSRANMTSQSSNDGLLGTGVYDTVVCEYFDPAPAVIERAITQFVPSHLGTLTITPSQFALGDMIIVTVLDSDQPATVQVLASVTGSSETVIIALNASSNSPGTYTGALNTSVLGTGSGSVVGFTYQDSSPFVLITKNMQSCFIGSISVEPINVAVGYYANVIVVDNDLIGVENVTCTVKSLDSINTALVLLRRTNLTGTFKGILFVSDSGIGNTVPDSSQITNVSAGENLLFFYNDFCPKEAPQVFVTVRYAALVQLSPAEILAGGLLQITVIDEDVFGQVNVNCTSGSSWANVVLTETGQGPGMFGGYLETRKYPNLCRPGFQIYCSYADEEPQNFVTNYVSVKSSMLGQLNCTTTTVLEGAVVSVSLQDTDIVTSTQLIIARTEFGSWPILLARTSANSTVFVASVYTVENSSYLPSTSNQIPVAAGGSLFFEYLDTAPYSNVTVQLTVISSTFGYPQIFPDPVSTDSQVYINVVDADLNTNPYLNEQVTVTVDVVESVGLISLTLLLSEVGLNNDTFQGMFRTVQLGGVNQAGTLAVTSGQHIEVVYNDNAPLGLRSAMVLVVQTKPAAFVISPRPALPGFPLQVTLVASGMDSESLTVSVVSVATDLGLLRVGAVGRLELLNSNGNFSATLYPMLPEKARYARNNQGMMNIVDVYYGDVITFTFLDNTPLTFVTYQHKVAAIGTLNISFPLKKNGEVLVTLNDSDINTNTLQVQQSFILVRDETANSSMFLNLTEIQADSSIFTGLLRISEIKTNLSAGVLSPVRISDNVSFTYIDAIPARNTTIFLIVDSSFPGTLTVNSRRINMGDDIIISLDDRDLSTSQYFTETFQLPVSISRSPSVALQKKVVLTETQVNSSGSFTGILRTTYGNLNGLIDNSVYDVTGGDVVTLVYHDVAPSSTITIPVKVAVLGSISIYPTVVNDYGTFTVTVTDFDLNLYASVSETWSDAVVVSVSTSAVAVVIVETGLDTSVFTGVVPSVPTTTTRTGYLQSASQGSIITAAYMDLFPGYGPAVSVVAQTIVATNGTVSISPDPVITDAFISIEVIDRDAGWNDNTVDNITVQAICRCSSEFLNQGGSPQCTFNPAQPTITGSLAVTLLETGVATGDFTGTLWLYSLRNGTNSSAMLRAPSGSIIQVVYNDTYPSPTVQRTAQKKVSTTGLVNILPSPVNENTAVTITVIDPDLDISDGKDTNWLAVICSFLILFLAGNNFGHGALRSGVYVNGQPINFDTCASPVRIVGPSQNSTGFPVPGYVPTGLNVLLVETDSHRQSFRDYFLSRRAI